MAFSLEEKNQFDACQGPCFNGLEEADVTASPNVLITHSLNFLLACWHMRQLQEGSPLLSVCYCSGCHPKGQASLFQVLLNGPSLCLLWSPLPLCSCCVHQTANLMRKSAGLLNIFPNHLDRQAAKASLSLVNELILTLNLIHLYTKIWHRLDNVKSLNLKKEILLTQTK